MGDDRKVKTFVLTVPAETWFKFTATIPKTVYNETTKKYEKQSINKVLNEMILERIRECQS